MIVIGRLKAPLLFKGGLRENEISVTLMTLTDIDKKRLKTTSRIENLKMEQRCFFGRKKNIENYVLI